MFGEGRGRQAWKSREELGKKGFQRYMRLWVMIRKFTILVVSDSFMGEVYMCQKLSNCTLKFILYQLYFNKTFFFKVGSNICFKCLRCGWVFQVSMSSLWLECGGETGSFRDFRSKIIPPSLSLLAFLLFSFLPSSDQHKALRW